MKTAEKRDCPACDGVGYVCLNCKNAIDDCMCGEDSEPCPCEKCSSLMGNEEPR